MDVYTTSFTYPARRARHIHSNSSSVDYAGPQQANDTPFPNHKSFNNNQLADDVSGPEVAEQVAKLAMLAMTLHGCHVSYFLADGGRGWNFTVTGAYQQVMIARGMIMKECPIQVSDSFHFFFFKPTDVLRSASLSYQSYTFRDSRLSFFEACS
jgi:hypothetical protein